MSWADKHGVGPFFLQYVHVCDYERLARYDPYGQEEEVLCYTDIKTSKRQRPESRGKKLPYAIHVRTSLHVAPTTHMCVSIFHRWYGEYQSPSNLGITIFV